MWKKKTLSLLIVLLLLMGFGCDSTRFSYEMAAPAGADDGLSFYEGPGDTILKPAAEETVRNVILCIGDGMGFSHVDLSRQTADVDRLWMETMPVRGEMSTWALNKKITDSAASGTAIACGVKTHNRMLGMTPDEQPYHTILELLKQKGYMSGLVVTCQVSHATPAAFVAHVKERDDQMTIVPQMLSSRVDVILGGGRKYWLPKEEGGTRTDGADWIQQARQQGCQVIGERDELFALTQTPVMGLFNLGGLTTFTPEPTLSEMSDVAIKLLDKESRNGFFLMIEGSQIDWAGHANDADKVIRQTLLFDMAVQRAIDFAKRDKHTLVVVTADHETGGLKLDPDGDGTFKPRWTTGGHTSDFVPVYAYGPGAKRFSGMLDNTDISKRIAELTGIAPFPVKKTD